jgi:hypothetical protein
MRLATVIRNLPTNRLLVVLALALAALALAVAVSG